MGEILDERVFPQRSCVAAAALRRRLPGGWKDEIPAVLRRLVRRGGTRALPGCWERRLPRVPHPPRHHETCVFPWEHPSPEAKLLGEGSWFLGAPGTGRPEEMDTGWKLPIPCAGCVVFVQAGLCQLQQSQKRCQLLGHPVPHVCLKQIIWWLCAPR